MSDVFGIYSSDAKKALSTLKSSSSWAIRLGSAGRCLAGREGGELFEDMVIAPGTPARLAGGNNRLSLDERTDAPGASLGGACEASGALGRQPLGEKA